MKTQWEDVAPDDASWTHILDSSGKAWKRGNEWPFSILALGRVAGLRFVRAAPPKAGEP